MTAAVTRPQVGRLHAVFAGLGLKVRGDRLRVLSAVTYRPISTTNDLTRAEASVAIDMLDGIGDVRLAELVEAGRPYLPAAS